MSLPHFSGEVIASWHQDITQMTQSFDLVQLFPKVQVQGDDFKVWWKQSVSVQQVSMSQWNLPYIPAISYTARFREISVTSGMEITLHSHTPTVSFTIPSPCPSVLFIFFFMQSPNYILSQVHIFLLDKPMLDIFWDSTLGLTTFKMFECEITSIYYCLLEKPASHGPTRAWFLGNEWQVSSIRPDPPVSYWLVRQKWHHLSFLQQLIWVKPII